MLSSATGLENALPSDDLIRFETGKFGNPDLSQYKKHCPVIYFIYIQCPINENRIDFNLAKCQLSYDQCEK